MSCVSLACLSAYDQNSSDYFYHIFVVETNDGKACMSPSVFDTTMESLIQRLGVGIATES